MLMNMNALLETAVENHFAVPAFNIGTCQFLNGIIELCEEVEAPVILAVHPLEQNFQRESGMAAVLKAAHNARVPVCVHLDHSGIADIVRAIRNGFTSVMIDASLMSFEDNVDMTKQVIKIARPLGISVEAELGTIGKNAGAAEEGTKDIIYTRPEEAREFVERTGTDTLAVAVGTAHGIYPPDFRPQLKLDLLSEIRQSVDVPLVLHGGSSNPDEEIKEAVRRGISKVNIASDIKYAFYKQLRRTLAENENMIEPFDIYPEAVKAMQQAALHKMELFGTVGTAQLYHF